MSEIDDLLAKAKKDTASPSKYLPDSVTPTYWDVEGQHYWLVEDLVDNLIDARERELAFRVTIEDTGPILEAIMSSHPLWDHMDLGTRAEAKQELLDHILPGLNVFLEQVNAQLAAR